MGFHTFTAGEVLTAANVNAFLMNQAVITCTSGTRPSSPVAGMTIYETDTTNYSVYTGTVWVTVATSGAWTAYTPTFTNGTVGNGTLVGRSKLIGKTMYLYVSFTFGSTSSLTASQLTISIPSPTPVSSPAVGAAFFSKGDFTNRASGVAQISTAMTLQAGTNPNLVNSTVPWAWVAGDSFAVNAVYETS